MQLADKHKYPWPSGDKWTSIQGLPRSDALEVDPSKKSYPDEELPEASEECTQNHCTNEEGNVERRQENRWWNYLATLRWPTTTWLQHAAC